MSNEIENEKNLRNDSAPLNDYEIEVEEPERKGFFAKIIDRIKSGNNTKLLDSGNKDTFQRTNRSISSMWTVASLRRVLMEKLETLNKSLFRSPEVIDQSNITTHVIGKDEQKKDDLSQTAEKSDFEPVIPISKSAAVRANRIIPQPVKTSIINNAKTAKDVKEEIAETQGIKAEEVEVSDEFALEYENDSLGIEDLTAGDVINNSSKNINKTTSSIDVGEINISGQEPKEVERNDDDDRDL